MDKYISGEAAVDVGYLSDWYISSVGDEPPVWTEAHIDELLNDFIVIPKDTKAADVQPVKRGRWLPAKGWFMSKCSECGYELGMVLAAGYICCPKCTARMDGDT